MRHRKSEGGLTGWRAAAGSVGTTVRIVFMRGGDTHDTTLVRTMPQVMSPPPPPKLQRPSLLHKRTCSGYLPHAPTLTLPPPPPTSDRRRQQRRGLGADLPRVPITYAPLPPPPLLERGLYRVPRPSRALPPPPLPLLGLSACPPPGLPFRLPRISRRLVPPPPRWLPKPPPRLPPRGQLRA